MSPICTWPFLHLNSLLLLTPRSSAALTTPVFLTSLSRSLLLRSGSSLPGSTSSHHSRLPVLLLESDSVVGVLLVCSGAHPMGLSGLIRRYMLHGGDMRVQRSETDTFYARVNDDFEGFVAGPPGFEPGTPGSEGRCPVLAGLRARVVCFVLGCFYYWFEPSAA